MQARIRDLSKLAEVTTTELDRLAGLSHGHVSRILRQPASMNRTSATVMAQIAHVFGCTLDYIVTGKGPKPVAADVRAAVERARRDKAS